MRVFPSPEELLAARGDHLGTSAWRVIEQSRIDTFADATDDHQWIHVDPERAAAGPYGAPIAHGYLTLSLLPAMTAEVVSYAFDPVRVNYGIDRVRFLAPVPAGARVRDDIVLADAVAAGSGVRVTLRHTVEIEHHGKPACIADTITLVVAAG